MEDKEVYYFYPKDKEGKALGHSIAVVIKDGRPFVGFAQLSSKDTFDRKKGRAIAEGRAREQLKRFEEAREKKNGERTELSDGQSDSKEAV